MNGPQLNFATQQLLRLLWQNDSGFHNRSDPLFRENHTMQQIDLDLEEFNHTLPVILQNLSELTNTSISFSNIFTDLISPQTSANPKEIQASSSLDSYDFLNTISLWVEGYILLPVALLGISINFAGIGFALQKKQRKKMFKLILMALLITDTTYLGCESLTCADMHLGSFLNLYVVAYLLHPLKRFCLFTSTFLTMALAYDRYCAVTSPIIHRSKIRSSEGRWRHLRRYLMWATAGAFVVTLPAFGELTVTNLPTNKMPMMLPSKMRLDPYYSFFYSGILCNLLLVIVPISFLSYFYYNTLKFGKNAPPTDDRKTRENLRLQQRRRKLTNTVRLIMISFVIFHIPRIITNIAEPIALLFGNCDDVMFCMPNCVEILKMFAQLFIVLNASVNVILYMLKWK